MKKTKYLSLLFCFLFVFQTVIKAQEEIDAKIVPPSWFANYVNVVSSNSTRFGPTKTNDVYLEYELMGRQGWFDFYGYVDFPKFFGIGSDHNSGFWDKNGAKAFADLQGRMSINRALGMGQNKGFLKEYFVSTNYIGNFAKESVGASSHVLWLGLGTTVNTYSKLNLDVNFYIRKTFTDYGSPKENTLQGYRLKMKWMYPVASLFNNQGALTYIGFGDYDFGTDKAPKEKPSNNIGSNDALMVTNVLDLSYKRVHFASVARYWHHGGGNRYNGGSFPVNTSGWGCYFIVGVKL